MHTLGHTFVPPPIHAGGLRYHGMAPLVSQPCVEGLIEAAGAATSSSATRRPCSSPAPRASSRRPRPATPSPAAIDEAKKAKEEGKEKVILFN